MGYFRSVKNKRLLTPSAKSGRRPGLSAFRRTLFAGAVAAVGLFGTQSVCAQSIPGTGACGPANWVVLETQPDSVPVYYVNRSAVSIVLGQPRIFPFYGDTVVRAYVPQTAVAPGDSVAIWVSARTVHNLVNSTPIFIPTNHPTGPVVINPTYQGRYSKTYYTATENLEEGPLRNALKTIVTANALSLGYNTARDHMYGTIDNVAGQVECVYTGRVATFNTRAGAVTNDFNCEHTFPQSFFGSANPMQSDLHHLFSTDESANTYRSNLPFGVVTGTPTWQVGGSKKGNGVFEPRDVHKGNAGRALLFFVVRHQDYANFVAPQEVLLRQWHRQFLPVAKDIARNNAIYSLQGNRNPLVDYPQFERRITQFIGPSYKTIAMAAETTEDTLKLEFSPTNSSVRFRRFAVANTGNTVFTVLGWSLSHSALSFAKGGSPGALQPGEVAEVVVAYPAGVDFSGEDLTILTNEPAVGNLEIPIRGRLAVGQSEQLKSQIGWYVNQRRLTLTQLQPGTAVRVYNVLGQQVATGTVRADAQEASWTSAPLPPGLYTVQATGWSGSVKVVVP
jgi:hypothetical protein